MVLWRNMKLVPSSSIAGKEQCVYKNFFKLPLRAVKTIAFWSRIKFSQSKAQQLLRLVFQVFFFTFLILIFVYIFRINSVGSSFQSVATLNKN